MEAGELTEVPLEDFQVVRGAPSPPQVVNIFIGTQPGEGAEIQRVAPQPPRHPPTCIYGGPRPPKRQPTPKGDEDVD